MPIVVNYGPIAGALQLADYAGQGQGNQIQAQRDMEAMQIGNEQQRTINQQYATQMQNALAQKQIEGEQGLRQATLAQTAAQQAAQLRLQQQEESRRMLEAQNTNMYHTSLAQSREDMAKSAAEERAAAAARNTAQANTLQNKLDNPTPPAPKADVGSIAVLNGSIREQQMAQAELQRLAASAAKANDPILGNPQQAAAIKQRMSEIQQRLDTVVTPNIDRLRKKLAPEDLPDGMTVTGNGQGGTTTTMPAGSAPSSMQQVLPRGQQAPQGQPTPAGVNMAHATIVQQAMQAVGSNDPFDPRVQNAVTQMMYSSQSQP